MTHEELKKLSEEELDEMVHDLKSEEAAEINNQGRDAQIAYILGGEIMKFIYYVDIPNPNTTGDDDSWINIAVVKTEKEAFAILLDRYGIKAEDASVFITMGEGL